MLVRQVLIPCLLWSFAPVPRALAETRTATEIVRRSLDRDRTNFNRARDYTYIQVIEEKRLNGDGTVSKVETSTFDVTMIGDSPYRRKVAENGKPLPDREARKVESAFEKTLRERREETPEQRKKRLAREEEERQESRVFAAEIPNAFQFRLAGEDVIDGLPVWVIDATQLPGYKPKDKRAEILTKFQGRIWVEKEDYQWVKVEGETTGRVSIGWFIARLEPGVKLTFLQKRVNSEVWMPAQAFTKFDARLALVKRLRAEISVTWKDYRKFQTDSRIVGTEEISPSKPEPSKTP
jgi:hypothetical protein